MKASVIVFPGSNCDRDIQVALRHSMGEEPQMVWHGDAEVPRSDLIVLPGGFSYGDYLRSGAIAANSPIMRDVVAKAGQGVPVLGICNGFQVLIESGLLPGALLRNAGMHFLCRDVGLRVENTGTVFTGHYEKGQIVTIPIAHHDGNYFADDATLERLEGEGRVAFRYCDSEGAAGEDANPNGSLNNIAGILNDGGSVLGMMPHPERLADPFLGGTDGKPMFDGLVEALS
ncbi:MAG: phosphoribosylformylglycinamidine synthase subunit PurQ [Hyphomicrobiales bacterium]|nr:MAG: phosphoribosylformylglycinamidine synthase subunit PurQ [Hyphomicrobiales bacterium]